MSSLLNFHTLSLGVVIFITRNVNRIDIGEILQLPAYVEIEESLNRVDGVHPPSEVHGILCGLLAKDVAASELRFVRLILGEVSVADVLAVEARDQLIALHAFTRAQLQDASLGLELLVPDDADPLDERISAACDWARGWVYGLAEQGITRANQLPDDSAEFLVDCMTLANGEYEAAEGEEGETIYMELLEYLRMGALMVQEELQPLQEVPGLH